MPKLTGERGASGIRGGAALARELDRMAAENSVKGLHAKVNYLTGSVGGQEAMIAAGIDLTNKSTHSTVLGWLSDEELHPGVGITHANARRVDEAYAARRRHTTGPHLKRRLSRDGGAQAEVHPVDQAAVAQKYRRELRQARVNIRPSDWESIVDAWDEGNDAELDTIWDDIADDQLYPPGAYALVSGIGINA